MSYIKLLFGVEECQTYLVTIDLFHILNVLAQFSIENRDLMIITYWGIDGNFYVNFSSSD